MTKREQHWLKYVRAAVISDSWFTQREAMKLLKVISIKFTGHDLADALRRNNDSHARH